MTSIATSQDTSRETSALVDSFPETVLVTASTICSWWMAGYVVSEHRDAHWLYLIARGNGESAVYKIAGPGFCDDGVVYQGFRIA